MQGGLYEKVTVYGRHKASSHQTRPRVYCARRKLGINHKHSRKEATLMGKKLFRGITNVATGWGEIPRQLVLTTQHEGALGIPLGFFTGVMMTAVRTAVGAAEIALFLAPTPGFYDPLLSPGLVWEHADDMDASPPAQPPAEDAADY